MNSAVPRQNPLPSSSLVIKPILMIKPFQRTLSEHGLKIRISHLCTSQPKMDSMSMNSSINLPKVLQLRNVMRKEPIALPLEPATSKTPKRNYAAEGEGGEGGRRGY
jgi:hypothetical protein